MKAEIGYVLDEDCRPIERMKLVITAQTRTEATALRMFALRFGLDYDALTGEVDLIEPAKETTIP